MAALRRLPRHDGRRDGAAVEKESAGKPDSVVDSHSSGPPVTVRLKQPTRVQPGPGHGTPIWSCSGWGFPCRRLLPATRCALTAPFHPCLRGIPCAHGTFHIGGMFSVALSIGSRRPGVTRHPALWSPDFPPVLAHQRLSGQLRARSYARRPAASQEICGHLFVCEDGAESRRARGLRL